MNVMNVKQDIYKDYPRCEICDSGGIASDDCPVCRSKIVEWYKQKLDMFIEDRQRRLYWAKKILDDQSQRMRNGDYDYD